MNHLARHLGDGDPERWDDAVRGALTFRTLFSREITPTRGLTAGVAEFAPGERLAPHWHVAPELYVVQSGDGVVDLGDDALPVRTGSTVFVPGGAVHGIRNTTSSTLSVFYALAADGFADVEYHFTEE
ncbi:cupin domain-containing protein [Pseudonocardia parietis]|uniref:Mannose-6-phosphate isomerase-like protein (Cupin superfamily) n=1 Tax=Pseudonocardia parietis TaxID=570936 RepID=A0ABS4VUZ7_9PSEU|nr:cupin domain-containing protein [Pseudonocardia parietis]MBP2367758.1 mannose-6-phosphate isomerase-like protein (cupin superfamily) [Pseudonocardia parietis]